MFFTCAISACDPKNGEPEAGPTEVPSAKSEITIDVAAATQELFSAGESALEASQSSADELKIAIEEFLNSPSLEKLAEAQSKWQQALLDFRKFSGPAQISIADADTFKQINRLDYQVATFPIQPGFLDTFGPHQYSGLVHDIGMEISEESLSAQHGLTDLSEAVLGLYPIEFMLFGRGETRDVEDFKKITKINKALRERGFESLEEIPNNRRRLLLQTQAELLSKNIQTLESVWNGPTAEARATWDNLAGGKKIALAKEALSGTLTRIMLEVSELNSEVSEDEDEDFSTTISPSVRSADFAFHQRFIASALSSLVALTNFYSENEQVALQQTLKALDELSKKSTLSEEQSAKDHWREVFKLIKRASDISNGEKVASKPKAPDTAEQIKEK